MTNHAPKQLYRAWRQSHPPVMRFTGRDAKPVEVWQTALREAFQECLGQMPEPLEPEAHMIEESDQGDHTRQKWILHTEAGFWLPFYLLLPKPAGNEARPAVIALHGHGPGKSRAAGIAATPEEEEMAFGGERDYGLQAVREGYIAFCPDMRGFGECVDEDHTDRADNFSCIGSSGRSIMLGRTLMGERVWDVQRAIDWLSTHPDVDGERIACVGHSGGGTITMAATAIEPRIKVSVISGYLCTWDQSIYGVYHCPCNYVPRLASLADCPDVVGLAAPRPQLFVSGEGDTIFPIDGVREAFAKVQEIYAAFGVEDRVELFVGSGDHRFYKKPVWPFIRRWFS